MKQNVRNIMAMAAMFVVSAGAWAAGEVVVVTQKSGTVDAAAGTVTSAQSNGVCTLTVTPAAGNYITVDNLSAIKVIDAGQAQARGNAPGMDTENITIAATDATADPSGATTYTFTMPSSEYDVQVTADFQPRVSIADAVITLSATSFVYDGTAKEPTVSSVVVGEATLSASDYDVAYANNTEVGTATVTLTGKGVYTNEATAEFQITVAASTITATSQTVTYNGEAQAITGVTVDKGEVLVTYYDTEADRSKGSNGYIDAPTNAGVYYVQVTQTDGHYSATPVDVTFTIEQAAITAVTLSATALTYTGEQQTVAVESVLAGELAVPESAYTVSGNVQTAVGTYTVTVTAVDGGNFSGSATATFTIANRSITAEDLSFADGQTFVSYYTQEEDLNLGNGLAAYIVTGVSGSSVTVQRISYIPQDVAVLVEKTTGGAAATDSDDTAFSDVGQGTAEADPDFAGNLLHGTAEPTAVSSIEGGAVYVLYNNEFVRTVSGTIPANRGYLVLNAQGAAGRLHIVCDGEPSGIASLTDGQHADNLWYDLSGRQQKDALSKPGLYIQQGRKVLVK